MVVSLNATQNEARNYQLAQLYACTTICFHIHTQAKKEQAVSSTLQHAVHLDTCVPPSEWRWT